MLSNGCFQIVSSLLLFFFDLKDFWKIVKLGIREPMEFCGFPDQFQFKKCVCE